MTIKLQKTKSPTWNGNGFGTTGADYIVKGRPDISVTFFAGRWNARDETADRVIAKADRLNDLRDILAAKL